VAVVVAEMEADLHQMELQDYLLLVVAVVVLLSAQVMVVQVL
jgi:hypothetical protein